MGILVKVFAGKTVKKCGGPVYGQLDDKGDDAFYLKIKNEWSPEAFQAYVLKLSRREARQLQRRLNEFLGTENHGG